MSSTSVYKYVQLYDIHDGNGRYDNIVTVIYVVIFVDFAITARSIENNCGGNCTDKFRGSFDKF